MHSNALKQGGVAFVTGAASGIGAATAKALAQAGAAVMLADVRDGEGEALARAIVDGGCRARYVHCDMQSEADIANAAKSAFDAWGALNIAFNNAGVEGEQAGTADCSNDNWDRVMAVNLKGVWLCMKHEIPLMLKSGGGAIVNCSSIAGLVGFANIPAYTASKHGVLGLTKAAALEYADKGIRVNAVCPGVIQTPMIERFTHGDPAAQAGLVANEPMARVGRPEEIASAVLWLAGDGASFTTGHALVVDGGWVAR
ncbi:MAG: SDR family oxidoreductase [Hyphomonadaceae bacterium]|nr:SDR family oxidoreductase [Hyphomonadaceae bacterium]